MDANSVAIVVMVGVFLYLGYQGVPVAFALAAGAFVTTAFFTKISLASMVGQMFNGINQLEFLAIPFFLLAGDMMTSANITERLIRFAQVFVGHFRSGLAHVVSLSSMLFAGISGSMTADVAAISTVVMPYMKREGYDPAFSAALVAAASTIAAMVPPSIMAIVYGAVGNVSIAGLFLGGATPGVLVGVGLMIYSYFFGPPGIRKRRAGLGQMATATRAALLPLMIPIIIVGGVASGVFTPAEAGMIAVVYIIVVLLPLMNRGHIRHLPRDFMEAAVLYSLPMSAVAAASAVGWLLAYLGGPDIVNGWIQAVAGDNRIVIMYLMVIVLTIAGDFLDGVPAIAIFMPIIVALTKLGHINPVHMGVLIIVSLAFGLITPPYGLILLLSSTLAGVPFTRALRQSIPLYGIFFLVITLIILFPEVVLWFPRLVIPQSVGCFPNPAGSGYICPPS
ncbi:MAG TPA: TRAP transporter large permease [Candidatus Methylomirabilis sp.]|nr:TRAP transporter large permease [Candidatus Methylomirabilis sp.]